MEWTCAPALEGIGAVSYTPEEKARIERILAAFQSYLDKNQDFEIFFTKTLGYVSLYKNGDIWLRSLTLEGLVGELCDHVILDTMYKPRIRSHLQNYPFPEEEAEGCRRYSALVQNLANEADRAYCMRLLDEFFETWREIERPYLPESWPAAPDGDGLR